MQCLFLDLASHQGMLACVADERVVSSLPLDHRVDDATLIPHVEDVLSGAGWSYADLTQLAYVVGPGGFTSLRVAVALGNALGSQLKIPVCGVHGSDVYAVRFLPSPPAPLPLRQERGALWLHSTKKTELFIRGFGDLANDFPEPVCITVDDLVGVVRERPLQWTGELIPDHQAIVTEAGVMPVVLRSLEEVLPGFLKDQHYTNAILQPWYGRGW